MTWLLAVLIRPLGALLLGTVALLIARMLWPLIPNGQTKTLLYDRTYRHRHPAIFTALLLVSVYGTVFTLVYIYWS